MNFLNAKYGLNVYLLMLVLALSVPVLALADDDDEAESGGFLERLFSGFYGDDEDEDESEPAQLEYVDGRAAIRLSAEIAERVGLEISALQETQYGAVMQARAQVLPFTELLDARAQDQQLQVRADSARHQIANHDAVLRDLRALKGRSRPPKQRFREAELARQNAAAQLGEIRAQRDAMALKLRLRWGAELALRVLQSTDEAVLETWLRDTAVLVVKLPPGQSLSAQALSAQAAQAVINIDVAGSAREAQLLGPASGRDGATTESWLVQTGSEGLRPGMWVSALISSTSQQSLSGVSVPASAVIWHYGKPWIYLQHEQGTYLRTPLEDYQSAGDDWFVPGQALVGKNIVVRGAQVLLSEESRWNIPAEDDDD